MRTLNVLSIVVPCYNEQEVLAETHRRLAVCMNELRRKNKILKHEIVYVNNGSTDRTQKVLEAIFKEDRHVRVVTLRSNFGFQGSISAGLYAAKGDAVVTIDADLQDPPEKIEEMIEHYEQGYDLVLGVRQDRKSDSFLKRFFAENFYRFMKVMAVDVVYNHGDFRLMDRSLVDEFNDLQERNRFIRAMVLKLDSHYALVRYDRAARRSGRSKFDVHSLISLSFDGLLSFSTMPLRLVSIIGLLMCVLAMVGVLIVIYSKLTAKLLPGWASTTLPIFLFSGFQIFALGLVGEYLGRLYIEVKQRPIFCVRKELSHDADDRNREPYIAVSKSSDQGVKHAKY